MTTSEVNRALADRNDDKIVSLRQQDAKYNAIYRKWRSDKSNKYTFYFSDGRREHQYSEGQGFVDENPYAVEYRAFRNTIDLTAVILISYTLITFMMKLLFSDFPTGGLFGLVLTKDGFFVGKGLAPVAASYLFNILGKLLPVCIALVAARIPVRVIMPLKITNKPLFSCCVPFAMMTFSAITVLHALEALILPSQVLKSQIGEWYAEGTANAVLMGLLYMVVIPVVSEIVHRGVFLQLYRQFGDGFALIMTCLIAAMTNMYGNFLYTMVYSAVIGYFTLKTGSILTAVVMRIIITGSHFGLMLYQYHSPSGYPVGAVVLMLLFGAAGIIGTIRFLLKYSRNISLPVSNLYITDTQKAATVILRPGMILWLGLMVMQTIYVLVIA